MLTDLDSKFAAAAEHNPFFSGESSDLLALIPFALLGLILWLVAREKLLSGRKA